jgi:hypothetical protein
LEIVNIGIGADSVVKSHKEVTFVGQNFSCGEKGLETLV